MFLLFALFNSDFTFGYTQRLQKCLKTCGLDVATFLSTNGQSVCKVISRLSVASTSPRFVVFVCCLSLLIDY